MFTFLAQFVFVLNISLTFERIYVLSSRNEFKIPWNFTRWINWRCLWNSFRGRVSETCVKRIYENKCVLDFRAIDAGQRLVLKNFLNKLQGENFKAPRLKYTDDTAMTKSVAKCLLNYDAERYQKELAVNFVKEYFVSPSRGYGDGTADLLHHLRRTKFEDVLAPASFSFNGQGSFGNGAAMRISPVALYCLNKPEEFLIDLVKKTSVVTHANVIGVNGAILLALAIVQNLKMDSSGGVDVNKYVDDLMVTFKKIETGEDE